MEKIRVLQELKNLVAPSVDVHTVKIALTNTIKPLGYVCLNPSLIELVLEMAAAVVGVEEALQERPIITALAEHHPLPLPSGVAARLDEIAKEAETRSEQGGNSR